MSNVKKDSWHSLNTFSQGREGQWGCKAYEASLSWVPGSRHTAGRGGGHGWTFYLGLHQNRAWHHWSQQQPRNSWLTSPDPSVGPLQILWALQSDCFSLLNSQLWLCVLFSCTGIVCDTSCLQVFQSPRMSWVPWAQKGCWHFPWWVQYFRKVSLCVVPTHIPFLWQKSVLLMQECILEKIIWILGRLT